MVSIFIKLREIDLSFTERKYKLLAVNTKSTPISATITDPSHVCSTVQYIIKTKDKR
jgi:hypothetical protein